jgi:hypothetical protein
MKISDLLRKIASQIDDKKKPVPLSMATGDKQNSKHIPASDDTSSMIPPLQQHLELLKKQSGVDSAFDGKSKLPDDLTQLKKMAGISQSANRTVGDPNGIKLS